MSSLNFEKLMNRFIRRVDNDGIVWDLMTGLIGIKTGEGVVTLTKEATGPLDDGDVSFGVSLNPMIDLSVAVPAFAQTVPLPTVQVGDLIYGADKPIGWVIKKNPKSFQVIKQDGHTSTYSPVKVPMMGMDGVMVVRSLASSFGSGDANAAAGPFGSMQQMLPLMLMMKDRKPGARGGVGSDMMPLMMMMMMGGGQGGGAMNPMLMMMLMGDGNPFGA